MTRKREPSSRQPKRQKRKPAEDGTVLPQEFEQPIRVARANTAFLRFPDRELSDERGSDFEVVDAEFSEIDRGNGLEYRKLKSDIVALLEQRLRDGGLSEPNAALLAHATMQHFQRADDLNDPQQAEIAIDLAVALLRGVDTLTAAFNSAAELALPKEAPEIWAERDRNRGETPIAFLSRVWGPWMEAGVLYQNDIKRLGDPSLVAIIRAYCHRQGIDASTVLPPPQSVRLERALAQAEPGSLTEMLIRERLRGRERLAHRRRERKTSP